MPITRPRYPPEFREQVAASVRAGRTPEELAREYEPTEPTIRSGVAQADRDRGSGPADEFGREGRTPWAPP